MPIPVTFLCQVLFGDENRTLHVYANPSGCSQPHDRLQHKQVFQHAVDFAWVSSVYCLADSGCACARACACSTVHVCACVLWADLNDMYPSQASIDGGGGAQLLVLHSSYRSHRKKWNGSQGISLVDVAGSQADDESASAHTVATSLRRALAAGERECEQDRARLAAKHRLVEHGLDLLSRWNNRSHQRRQRNEPSAHGQGGGPGCCSEGLLPLLRPPATSELLRFSSPPPFRSGNNSLDGHNHASMEAMVVEHDGMSRSGVESHPLPAKAGKKPRRSLKATSVEMRRVAEGWVATVTVSNPNAMPAEGLALSASSAQLELESSSWATSSLAAGQSVQLTATVRIARPPPPSVTHATVALTISHTHEGTDLAATLELPLWAELGQVSGNPSPQAHNAQPEGSTVEYKLLLATQDDPMSHHDSLWLKRLLTHLLDTRAGLRRVDAPPKLHGGNKDGLPLTWEAQSPSLSSVSSVGCSAPSELHYHPQCWPSPSMLLRVSDFAARWSRSPFLQRC